MEELYGKFIGFFFPTDWKDLWLICLPVILLVALLVIVSIPRKVELRLYLAGVSVLIFFGVFFAVWMSCLLMKELESIKGNSPFDSDVLFAGLVSMPFLMKMLTEALRTTFKLCQAIVSVTRAESRDQERVPSYDRH